MHFARGKMARGRRRNRPRPLALMRRVFQGAAATTSIVARLEARLYRPITRRNRFEHATTP
jgi:hypothetical protein